MAIVALIVALVAFAFEFGSSQLIATTAIGEWHRTANATCVIGSKRKRLSTGWLGCPCPRIVLFFARLFSRLWLYWFFILRWLGLPRLGGCARTESQYRHREYETVHVLVIRFPRSIYSTVLQRSRVYFSRMSSTENPGLVCLTLSVSPSTQ